MSDPYRTPAVMVEIDFPPAFIHPRMLNACGLPRRFDFHGIKVRECEELRDNDIALTVAE